MSARPFTLLLCVVLPLACSKQDDAPASDAKGEQAKGEDVKGEDVKGEQAKAAADGKEGKTDGADAKVAAGSNAGGGEVVSPDAVTECPKSLSGKDTVDRVITKECGVVPVTGTYRVDGATLTLQAGATLAFADGASLQVGYYEPAKLVVSGTAEAPVTLTTSADKVAGVWEGVALYAKADRSSLQGLVIEYAGKKNAALTIEAEDVVVKGCTVRDAKAHAVEVKGEGTATLDGNTFERLGPIAMRLSAVAAGGVGEGNTFGAGALVQVQAGKIQRDVTWAKIGAPWLMTGRVQVHGDAGHRATLTLAAGSELRFDGDGRIDVGYYAEGGLVAEGTADAPIQFLANERQEAGGWNGLRAYGKSEVRIQHARFAHGGKDEGEGALLIDAQARVSVRDTVFESNRVGVSIRGKKAELEAFDGVTFKDTPVAMQLPARYVGALGAGNTYEGEPRLVMQADKLEKDSTWQLQPGAKLELEGKLQVSGATLELSPGIEVSAKDGVEWQVGYYDTAALRLMGTADKPITLRGQRDEPGTWGGVVLYGKARGNAFEHVVLRNAGGQAGLRFDGEADGTVKSVRCDSCTTPTLKWHCKSKIEHDAVEAGEGTPSALEAPKCK